MKKNEIPPHDKLESIQLRSPFLSNNLPLINLFLFIQTFYKGIHNPNHTQKWNPSNYTFFYWPDPLYVAFVRKQSSIILWQVFVQHTRIVLRSHFVQIYLEKVKLVKIWISQKYSWKFQICFCFISFPPFNVEIWESIAFCWNWEQNLVENT